MDKFINTLNIFKQQKSNPHLLITTNNTLFISDIIKTYIENIYTTNNKVTNDFIYYVNCSKTNNIIFLREILLTWIRNSFSIQHKPPYFRTIFLINPEELSLQFQGALRRIIEIYSVYNRFVFITTNNSKLIEPIQSRMKQISVLDITNTNIDTLTDPKFDVWRERMLKNSRLYNMINAYNPSTTVDTTTDTISYIDFVKQVENTFDFLLQHNITIIDSRYYLETILNNLLNKTVYNKQSLLSLWDKLHTIKHNNDIEVFKLYTILFYEIHKQTQEIQQTQETQQIH